jgi:hypothetical protein
MILHELSDGTILQFLEWVLMALRFSIKAKHATESYK